MKKFLTQLNSLSKAGFLKLVSEVKDPAVQRGIMVAIAMWGIKKGLDQEHADTLSSGIWSALTILVSRAPGKST